MTAILGITKKANTDRIQKSIKGFFRWKWTCANRKKYILNQGIITQGITSLFLLVKFFYIFNGFY